jgi:hypothetical protein
MFKVGDWVKTTGMPFKVDEPVLSDIDCGELEVELWKPKEGEWCWFRSESMPKYIQVLAQFKEVYNEVDHIRYCVMYKQEDVEEGVISIHYSECEPFIGQLPSFIKDI